MPVDGLSELEFEKLKPGVVYEVSTKKDRSRPQDNLYWACCHLLADNMDGLDKNAVALLTKIKCGLGIPVELVQTGELIMVPRSTAIESLDGDDFNDYFTAAKRFWTQTLIPGLGKADLEREAMNLLGEDYAAHKRR